MKLKLISAYLFLSSAILLNTLSAQESPNYLIDSSVATPVVVKPVVEVSGQVSLQSAKLLEDGTIINHPNVQPFFNVAYGNFNACAWGNLFLNKSFNSYTSYSAIVDHSQPLDDQLSFSLGLRYENYKEHNRKSSFATGHHVSKGRGSRNGHSYNHERFLDAYAGLTYNYFLNPTVTFYANLHAKNEYEAGNSFYEKFTKTNRSHGFFFNLNLSHYIENFYHINEYAVAFSFDANINWRDSKYNNFLYGVHKATFSDANATVSLPISCDGNWTVSPYITVTTLINHTIREKFKDREGVIYGINLSTNW